MKSQKEIYEALLAGHTLKCNRTGTTPYLARMNSEGTMECSSSYGDFWIEGSKSFSIPSEWQIYVEPKKPMTLECECEWDESGFIYPQQSGLHEILTPFIGKRTKMTLVEILEDEK